MTEDATEGRDEARRRRWGLALLVLSALLLCAAVVAPLRGASLGISEALLILALPSGIAGLVMRARSRV